MNRMQTFTLYELNALVREAIETELSHEYWVEAELSEARESRGHCYMELIQKEELSNTPIARASAKCWRSAWAIIQPHFERVTGERLHPDMKVRLKVYAQFHEAFGFSWIVTDIDPNYTLGDMARRRQEVIAQLKREGVFDLQRELSLPLFCLRIAVISSQTAAGYGDFCQQLSESPFAFRTTLFPAVMQGEQIEESIISALNAIYGQPDAFDCVVIIRGGGATSDMSGFDTLPLAENVAQFPLPIITGIGHDRDESVLDMVSFQRVKTPTAAAALLIDHAQQVLNRLTALAERIPTLFSLARTRSEARLSQYEQRLATATMRHVDMAQNRIALLRTRLLPLIPHLLEAHRHRLELLGQRVASLDPQLLLKRGYSITTLNGKAVRNAAALQPGDEIETRLSEGTIKSVVK
ncbi:MAG: exodeoxyribonuclease VII large subunit [Prevotella sp.]|nr:exodeoxyribonuclease VII large subunit [Prevotella sp.]